MATDSYFYLERHIETFMMSNSRGPIRTQNISMQRMSNYNMSTKNIPNSHVCSTVKRKPRRINAEKSEKKGLMSMRVIRARAN